MTPAEHTARFRQAVMDGRAGYVRGTPEKYPNAVCSVRILDAEAVLAALEDRDARIQEQAEEIAAKEREAYAARARITELEHAERDALTEVGQLDRAYTDAEAERDAALTALRRIEGQIIGKGSAETMRLIARAALDRAAVERTQE